MIPYVPTVFFLLVIMLVWLEILQVFRKCVDVDPEHAGHAWMYLGQFMEGKQALESFANGVKSFQKQIEDLQENMHNDEKYGEDVKIASKERELLTRQLMSAYSTMAELYMTDLCDDEDAEQRCEEILMHALQCDDRNVEVLSTLANFRLCQQKPDVAKQAIHEAANRLSEIEDEVQKHYVMAHDPDNEKMDGQSNGNNGPAVSSVLAPALPPYATRSSLAKAAMETECYSDALTVLEGLLAEDDTDLELWFLIAEAYFHSGDPHTALQYVGDALQEVNKRLERGSGDEQEKAENNAAKSQLTKLQKAIKSNIEG